MNNNALRVQVEFSFKGETYILDQVIDLEQVSHEEDGSPDVHRLLARKAGIDPISYLYEVLESHDLYFSAATGVAADYCRNGQFDWHGFNLARREGADWERVLSIVRSHISAHELDSSPALRAALLAAYRAGAQRERM